MNTDILETLGVDNVEALCIGYLQERGYSVAATDMNIKTEIGQDTKDYISSKLIGNKVYSLNCIADLLLDKELDDIDIIDDIGQIAHSFKQKQGKPETVML